jgi:predicted MFS family arabinose efflux permease
MRFAHGFVGGMLVGIGFSIIARTTHPDRTFGYLLVVQFGLGGAGLMVLPPLVPVIGTGVLFGSLIGFSLVTLLMVPFLTDYPIDSVKRPAIAGEPGIQRGPLALSLLATFLFQAGNMAVYAYVIGLGQAAGLSMEFISPTLAAAAWIGIVGSGLVIVLPTRLGRTLPLGTAILVTAVATWALNYSGVSLVYIVANCVVGITWAFGIPYLLGMCAQFDKAGQMAALGGFASKMGLASGPMIAALVVGADNYSLVVNLGAAALVICLLAALLPMRLLDRSRV